MNCLTYALRRVWQERGGYLVIRKSRHGCYPHVVYSRDLVTFEDYFPRYPRRLLLPPLWFAGRVRRWQGAEPPFRRER